MRFVFVFMFATISIATTSLLYSNVFAQSPHESGYDHECDDVKIFDPNDRYINQSGKGTDYHTNEFIDGYSNGFDSCRDNSDDDYDCDTDFDRFGKAQVNNNGQIDRDYDVYGDDGHSTDYNNNAEGIENLQLYRNLMPGPIDSDTDNPKDLLLEFGECEGDQCKALHDYLTVLLVPAEWSDERILNSVLDSCSDNLYDYRVSSEYCQYLNEDSSSNFDRMPMKMKPKLRIENTDL